MCRQWARTHADMESTGEHPSVMQGIAETAELTEARRVLPFGLGATINSSVFLRFCEEMRLNNEEAMKESRILRAFEESRKKWYERRMDQVQASELPSAHADVIVDWSSLDERRRKEDEEGFSEAHAGVIVDWRILVRKAIYERRRKEEKSDEQDFSCFVFPLGLNRNGYEAERRNMNWDQNELVGLLIEKLEDLLSAGTMRAEVYASLKPEVVVRMYQMYTEAFGRFIVKFEGLLKTSMMYFFQIKVEQTYYAEFEEFLAEQMCYAVKKMSPRQMKAQAELLYAVAVSAISLLVFVYQYLIGHIDKGGTLTCSSGSFQFRATFIPIVLFEGAYVWIKFRDVASRSIEGGYRRPRKDNLSGVIKFSKPEARYTPPGQSGNHIYLGVCVDDEEVKVKKQIAACCYGKGVDQVEPGYGVYFPISSMLTEPEQGLSVSEKREWVRHKVKQVYGEYRKEVDIVRQIVAFYHDEGEGQVELGYGVYLPISSIMVTEPEQHLPVPEKREWVRHKVKQVYGEYRKEVDIVRQIVAFYHDEGEGQVELGYGVYLPISSIMVTEPEQHLPVPEKREWVRHKVKQVYGEYRKEVDIVRQIVAFYHDEGEGRLDLPDGNVFNIPLMSPEDAECEEKEILIRGKVREAYEGFRKERADHNQHINPSQVETDGSVDGPSTGAPSSFHHHALDPHPQQESDAEALLTVMVTDLQNMVTDKDQMLEERWQMLQQGEHKFQAMMLTITELQQVVKDKDQSYQECLQKIEALQRMLEVKDRRIFELELEKHIREARNINTY